MQEKEGEEKGEYQDGKIGKGSPLWRSRKEVNTIEGRCVIQKKGYLKKATSIYTVLFLKTEMHVTPYININVQFQ